MRKDVVKNFVIILATWCPHNHLTREFGCDVRLRKLIAIFASSVLAILIFTCNEKLVNKKKIYLFLPAIWSEPLNAGMLASIRTNTLIYTHKSVKIFSAKWTVTQFRRFTFLRKRKKTYMRASWYDRCKTSHDQIIVSVLTSFPALVTFELYSGSYLWLLWLKRLIRTYCRRFLITRANAAQTVKQLAAGS